MTLTHAIRERKVPAQKPGRSKQDYATPREFLAAVKVKFGIHEWAWDLAAVRENCVCPNYYGPDATAIAHRDALLCDWTKRRGDLWLNPPYADIAPWAEKCGSTQVLRRKNAGNSEAGRIFFLVPAAVGSNWFANHVDGKARVIFPRPRLSFDGKAPYPKDVLLAVFGEIPGYKCWRWQS